MLISHFMESLLCWYYKNIALDTRHEPVLRLDPTVKLDVDAKNDNELTITLPTPNVMGSVISDELSEFELATVRFRVVDDQHRYYDLNVRDGSIR